jgi:hypothetical protein
MLPDLKGQFLPPSDKSPDLYIVYKNAVAESSYSSLKITSIRLSGISQIKATVI